MPAQTTGLENDSNVYVYFKESYQVTPAYTGQSKPSCVLTGEVSQGRYLFAQFEWLEQQTLPSVRRSGEDAS